MAAVFLSPASRWIATNANAQRSRRVGWAAMGMLGAIVPPSLSLCEDKSGSSILDTLLPKHEDGTIYWDKASSQITEKVFWDKLAQSAGSKVQGAIDSGVPTTISYGFVSGFCSGYALKKVGRAVSVVFGLGFMTLQTLSYYGYVNVDHGQIQKDFNTMLDQNNDGKIDMEDGKLALAKTMKVLEFNLPAGGGFAAGFIGGARTG